MYFKLEDFKIEDPDVKTIDDVWIVVNRVVPAPYKKIFYKVSLKSMSHSTNAGILEILYNSMFSGASNGDTLSPDKSYWHYQLEFNLKDTLIDPVIGFRIRKYAILEEEYDNVWVRFLVKADYDLVEPDENPY
ncbi:MAG: hypothetical protein ACUVQP_00180 [Bacteroidales bacterium]